MTERRVTADVIQQYNREQFKLMYLPVLYVDGKLTTISGEEAVSDKQKAMNTASKYMDEVITLLKKEE